jgi:hypothetical protein
MKPLKTKSESDLEHLSEKKIIQMIGEYLKSLQSGKKENKGNSGSKGGSKKQTE